jgi:hypothetical protein
MKKIVIYSNLFFDVWFDKKGIDNRKDATSFNQSLSAMKNGSIDLCFFALS